MLALAEGRAGKTYLGHIVDAPVTIDGLLNGLLVPTERQGQAEANRVARILRSNGWERYKARVGGSRVWAYRRPG